MLFRGDLLTRFGRAVNDPPYDWGGDRLSLPARVLSTKAQHPLQAAAIVQKVGDEAEAVTAPAGSASPRPNLCGGGAAAGTNSSGTELMQ